MIRIALLIGTLSIPVQAEAIPSKAERALLKEWALARCLSIAGKGQVLGDDAGKSAAAILERSGSAIEIFERIDKMAAAA